MTPLRPAPHHTPAQTPEAAYARQLALARSSDVLDGAALLRLYEGMLRVEAFERTLEARYFAGKMAGPLHLEEGFQQPRDRSPKRGSEIERSQMRSSRRATVRLGRQKVDYR